MSAWFSNLSSVVKQLLCHAATMQATVCPTLRETLLHTAAGQQQLVFTLAKFVLTRQKYRGDTLLGPWKHTDHSEKWDCRWVVNGKPNLARGCLGACMRLFISCFHDGILFCIVQSFWLRYNRYTEKPYCGFIDVD